MRSIDELKILLRANTPLIHVVTHEEVRFRRELSEVLEDTPMRKLRHWSMTSGLLDEDNIRAASTEAAEKVLSYILQDEEDTVYLLQDFDDHLRIPKVARMLRELTQALPEGTYKKHVILVGPLKISIPTLEKEMVIVDYDLPGEDMISDHLDAFASDRVENEKKDLGYYGNPEIKAKIVDALLGLTWVEAMNAIAQSIVKDGDLLPATLLVQKKKVVRTSGALEYIEPNTSLVDVAGLDVVKSWVNRRIVSDPSAALEYGLTPPKGVMLVGIPGCGKSLSAKAIAGSLGIPLLRLDIGKVMGKLVGQSEENIGQALKVASAIGRCVLWADEIEKSVSASIGGSSGDSGTSARVLATLLTWLAEKQDQVFCIFTANDVLALPPELTRKGRIDEVFFVDLPSREEREDLFQIHLRKRNRSWDDIHLSELSVLSKGFTGSEIEQVIIDALYACYEKGADMHDYKSLSEELVAEIRAVIPMSTSRASEVNAFREWAAQNARAASTSLIRKKNIRGVK